jgi:hypothetical protein
MCRRDGRQAMLEPDNMGRSRSSIGDRDQSRGVLTSPWQFDKRTCRIVCAASIVASWSFRIML